MSLVPASSLYGGTIWSLETTQASRILLNFINKLSKGIYYKHDVHSTWLNQMAARRFQARLARTKKWILTRTIGLSNIDEYRRP
jgi:hypothetical protein